eukprot:CAMPEP_0169317064 /NCGR_PEP_ID=MMETSP1017-20121227/6513_1 /TAXON_ID=342587 /ORGANISM="Karlodinium micrum, Strain CCMP2283" /LENGTH=253 /DNA_ID=CAMNT_0009411167 /DNA_START=23 /DNA_END=784 /DNA_ORIENTATION=+
MHRNVAAQNVRITKEETDKMEEENERLEEELRRIREMRSAFSAQPAPPEQSSTVEPAFRWRSAADDCVDEADHRFIASDSPRAELRISRNAQQDRAESERPRVRRAGEFGSIEAFLGELGLSRYAALFRERGLDSVDAIVALDPRRLRALGVDNKHAMKLRMGIAELRAFSTSQPAASRSGQPSTGAPDAPRSIAPIVERPPLAPRRLPLIEPSSDQRIKGTRANSIRARSVEGASSRSNVSRAVKAHSSFAR